MKKDIRNEILLKARDLFNEYGYNNVSMRDIAEATGISVGNLTYHYKRKETLVEAVILKQHESYHKKPVPETLEDLNGIFKNMIRHQQKNAYYFRHYKQLAQLSPKVYALQKQVIGDLLACLVEGFSKLSLKGVFSQEEQPGRNLYISQAVLSVIIYGIPGEPADRLSCIWGLIHPLLTKEGQALYHKILKTDGIQV